MVREEPEPTEVTQFLEEREMPGRERSSSKQLWPGACC